MDPTVVPEKLCCPFAGAAGGGEQLMAVGNRVNIRAHDCFTHTGH